VRVIVVKGETGADKLGFEYLDGPVTPKPERLPEPRRAKPRRRTAARRPKPPGPKGDGGGSPPRRGSVPKVPLVKV
jgi:ATP-dependent Clp protease ATP-binding subunit ClpA